MAKLWTQRGGIGPRMVPLTKWRPQGLSLRYFMVGNNDAGYQGIERDMDGPLKEMGNELCWTYKILTEDECAQVLRARCPDL